MNKDYRPGGLGTMMIKQGIITDAQLEVALDKQKKEGGFLGQTLLEMGFIGQDVLVQFLVKQCKIPHLSLLDYKINKDVLEIISKDTCLKHNLLPIDKLGRILTVAMVDPLDTVALDELRKNHPELRIKPILCNWTHFKMTAEKVFNTRNIVELYQKPDVIEEDTTYIRIAIGGSAANPPHNGHISLLRQLMNCGLFDFIIWLPSGARYDKEIEISSDDRVAMTELSIPQEWRLRSDPKIILRYDEVYGMESTSYFRLCQIKAEYERKYENKEVRVFWYTGSDSDVKTWGNGDWMLKNKMFVFIPRSGYPQQYENAIDYNFPELPNISSSDIRQMIREGKPIDHLVNQNVATYIEKNNLYV